MSDIEVIKEIIKNADSVVFFGGAGVSTESGIPDFRGTGGLYTDRRQTAPRHSKRRVPCWRTDAARKAACI